MSSWELELLEKGYFIEVIVESNVVIDRMLKLGKNGRNKYIIFFFFYRLVF